MFVTTIKKTDSPDWYFAESLALGTTQKTKALQHSFSRYLATTFIALLDTILPSPIYTCTDQYMYIMINNGGHP